MTAKIEIREGRPHDIPMIEALYPQAFPDEDLLPLIGELLQETSGVISLVAMTGQTVAGHVVFTICRISGRPGEVALLGPLAVAPRLQKQGVGTAIVRAGLQLLEKSDVKWIYVLGDPAYYSRFGFQPDGKVAPPYELPAEWRGAWQSLGLHGAKPLIAGKFLVPPPWRKKALWLP